MNYFLGLLSAFRSIMSYGFLEKTPLFVMIGLRVEIFSKLVCLYY